MVISGTAIELVTPSMERDPERNVVLEFDPADVALARHRVEGTSIGNQIEGTVTRWTDDGVGVFVEVRLGADGPTVAAEIGRESLVALDIEAGRRIVCLLKRQAIRIL